MSIPKNEQETVLTFYRDGKSITVFTSDSTIMTKMDNLCKKNPNAYKFIKDSICNGEITGRFYSMDKKMLSFRTRIRSPKKEKAEDID